MFRGVSAHFLDRNNPLILIFIDDWKANIDDGKANIDDGKLISMKGRLLSVEVRLKGRLMRRIAR